MKIVVQQVAFTHENVIHEYYKIECDTGAHRDFGIAQLMGVSVTEYYEVAYRKYHCESDESIDKSGVRWRVLFKRKRDAIRMIKEYIEPNIVMNKLKCHY